MRKKIDNFSILTNIKEINFVMFMGYFTLIHWFLYPICTRTNLNY